MNQNTNMQTDDEIEIDLMELFLAFKRRIWLILAAAVLGMGVAGAFSKLALTPQYKSTAMLYILSKETTLTSLADLQIGSQLTQDYKIIVVSRPVLEEVIEKLDLELDYRQLAAKLEITNPKDTRILSITAQDADPKMAKIIVDEVANTASSYIGDIMEMVPPKMIEDGAIPTHKSSPSNTKNALMGGIAAAMIVCGLIALEVIMNDTVTTEDDVTKYLGLSVLASVPERPDFDEDPDEEPVKSRRKTKRRKRG